MPVPISNLRPLFDADCLTNSGAADVRFEQAIPTANEHTGETDIVPEAGE